MGTFAFVALALAAAPPAGHGNVPFVGCPSDGQQGPQPAPRSGQVPLVPPAAAARLTYYSSGELGILAPRGWHCLGLAGSNGSSLVVTPTPHRAGELLGGAFALRGPAVQIAISFGGTSGRLQIANVVARAFPEHREFARRVAAEGLVDAVPEGPYPADRLVRLRPTVIGYRTPARQRGLGTDAWLAPDDRPIDGLAILDTSGDWTLVKLDVRLAAGEAGLATMILNAALPPRAAPRLNRR